MTHTNRQAPTRPPATQQAARPARPPIVQRAAPWTPTANHHSEPARPAGLPTARRNRHARPVAGASPASPVPFQPVDMDLHISLLALYDGKDNAPGVSP